MLFRNIGINVQDYMVLQTETKPKSGVTVTTGTIYFRRTALAMYVSSLPKTLHLMGLVSINLKL
jgi:hypothetical protein